MKKTPITTYLNYPLALIFCAFCTASQAQVIYSNGFEDLPVGHASDKDIKSTWSSRYAKGPDEGRVNIIAAGHTGKAAKIKYPKNGNQSTPSGATWETDIGRSGDEMYMSYWVKFDQNFDFVKGGKLPGLAGSTDFPYGDNGFTTRLMWREGGKLEFYLHGYEVNNSSGAEPYRLLWDTAGYHAKVTPGQWHHIEIRQKLNTPGQRNGILQGWLDGQLVCNDSDNSGVRGAGHSNTKINHLYFSTFFGGSSAPESQWQPKTDVFASFDDFIVSTARIGINGKVIPQPDAGSGSGSGSNTDTCIALASNGAQHEVDLNKGNCVQFDENIAGKTLAVWDSDSNSSCDFRGNVISIDGTGLLNVPDNYEATNSMSGTQLKIEPTNSCKFLKIRAL